MKRRIVTFFLFYVFFVLFFLIEKLFFLFYHFTIYGNAGFTDWLLILKHGLPLDFSMAGYLSVIPGLAIAASAYVSNRITKQIISIYIICIAVPLSILFIVDPVLFGYWGVHIDKSVFIYMENMKDVFASVTILEIVLAFIGMGVVFAMFLFTYKILICKQLPRFSRPNRPVTAFVVVFLLTGLLFIPIRGGFSVSTMNVGKVYFSPNPHYNQAAINPYFNFMYSLFKSENYSEDFHFMPTDEMNALFSQLTDSSEQDSIPRLFNTDRPNIILFVLESFGAVVCEPLGGIKDVTPNLTKYAEEGILFTNMYTNSFRTDRGLVSILSGYPAQAATSIMKYPNKTASLPAIPKKLADYGYESELVYGGDINFTNMQSYFYGCCHFNTILSDKDFSSQNRTGKWGIEDHVLIDTLINITNQQQLAEPFFKMALTLSSHEPFEVPFHKFEDKYLNSIAYTDSCLGNFVEKFRQTPYWDNSLIIFIPDHAAAYPQGIEAFNPKRYHIPLIFFGGAVKQPERISQFGSQMDLAAILFSQLNIPYDDFTFSKNILNPKTPQFAYYSFNNGFGFIDSTGVVVYDHNAGKIVMQSDGIDATLMLKAKSLTQYSYEDFEER